MVTAPPEVVTENVGVATIATAPVSAVEGTVTVIVSVAVISYRTSASQVIVTTVSEVLLP